MGLILTSLTPISREEHRVDNHHEVIEVFRDPANNLVRFHVIITPTLRQADVCVLVQHRWSRLHHLLRIFNVEDSLTRLFVVAASLLDWPEDDAQGSS